MVSFALVTEGITDQAVLETILCGYYEEEPEINPLQPLRDATDESRQSDGSFGGWGQVLEYCEYGDLQGALLFNDYLIIHMDTDCGRFFGVSVADGDGDRPVADIVDDVRKVLVSKFKDDFYQEFQDRILFAISVHSLECWLLPLHVSMPNGRGQTKSCDKRLERAVQTKLNKDYRAYKVLSKDYRKKAAIETARQCNESFHVFLSSLPAD